MPRIVRQKERRVGLYPIANTRIFSQCVLVSGANGNPPIDEGNQTQSRLPLAAAVSTEWIISSSAHAAGTDNRIEYATASNRETNIYNMNTKSLIIVALTTVGIVVLASLGLSFLTPGKPVEFLGINIAKADGQFIPPVAGACVFVGGIILLLVKSKRIS